MVVMRSRSALATLALAIVATLFAVTGCATLRSSGTGGAGSVWLWDNPRMAGNNLNAVAFSNGQDGWAVGARGTIVHTLNAGGPDTVGVAPFTGPQVIQTRTEFSGTTADLFGVAVSRTDTRTAFAVGDNGTILRTTNGGRTWLSMDTHSVTNLWGIDILTPSQAVAVGMGGTIRLWNGTRWLTASSPTRWDLFSVDLVSGAIGYAGGYNAAIIKTVDGGAHWATVPNNLPADCAVHGISFTSASVGCAVTWNGADGALWRTANGGMTWTKVYTQPGVALDSVSASGTAEAFASGTHGFLLHWAGSSIATTSVGAGAMRGTCVRGGTAWAVGDRGVVYAADSGVWVQKSFSATDAGLKGYSGVKQWAVGASGTLLQWNGLFTNAPTVTTLPTAADLTAIAFLDSSTGWIAAADGTVFRYTGGSLAGTSSVTVTPTSVTATDAADVWVCGNLGSTGYVLRSSDGGSTWTTTTSCPNVHLDGISAKGSHVYAVGAYTSASHDKAVAAFDGATWTTTGWPDGTPLHAVCAVTTDTVVAVGDRGDIIRSVDGGKHWTFIAAAWGNLDAVSFRDQTEGRAVGSRGVAFATKDGGVTWTPQDSGTYDDLLAVDINGTRRAVGTRGCALLEALVNVQELSGRDRYATAIDVSRNTWADGSATTTILATGENWPDAVCGSSLAGAVDGPMLLTRRTALPAGLVTEMKRLGVVKAYVLGSGSVVDTAVVTELKSQMGPGFQALRIAGSDRYATSAKVASTTVAEIVAHGGSYDHSAFLTTGLNWPDALAVAPVATHAKEPVLLTRPGGLPSVVASACSSLEVSAGVVLGSPTVVPQPVADQFASAIGATPQRWFGADRYGTASEIASGGVTQKGMSSQSVALATGFDFPDALSGGVAQGRLNGPLLLTPPYVLAPDAASFVSAHHPFELRFIGGLNVLPARPRNEAAWAILSGF
jgi:photosystem II stability/assembly factor-like uncharacterized protein/putative cell wall-binding protein